MIALLALFAGNLLGLGARRVSVANPRLGAVGTAALFLVGVVVLFLVARDAFAVSVALWALGLVTGYTGLGTGYIQRQRARQRSEGSSD